ncbi:hypothetical protein JAO76_14180 [Pontibacter sp. BT310]|uniref:Uncharacterized protein n=1 Tax=Pontibacter populi TaxID=890055 RepID=A0ABS6XDZ7_9BACT|nr:MULTISPECIES: hypothetical protein [Pontibacter]MBJ6119353.1 hypothetical protein [Pontibacter sp. BT310]MBR0571781.1 hypothetical protein [Microvirga sp. STS03]MBW3366207.1 hypothetical protein [Pontibacter populi]
MKKTLLKTGLLSLATLAFMGCESQNEIEEMNPTTSQAIVAGTCDVIDFENAPVGEFITGVNSANGVAVMVHNKARNSSGEMLNDNRAMIYDTRKITGDDEDLYTPEWGNTLIIQEIGVNPVDDPNVYGDGPNDNQWGGEMMLTFSKAMTLESMKVLDIDTYEDNSWVYLYNENGKELYKVKLLPLGNSSKQTVDLKKTAGVKTMKVVLAGTQSYSGSGAIDDIMFCETAVTPPTDEVTGCTRTQGYWKNHADPKKKQYNNAWDDYLGKMFYNSGQNYLTVLNTAPKGGDAYYILAHQFIAAELNVVSGASIPADVKAAWDAAEAYFKGETKPTRSELLAWAELLDAYNNGKVGPGHCD